MEEEKGVVPLQANKLLLFLIAPYIPATDRVRLSSSVCRLWRQVLRQDDVWQRDYEHVISKMSCLACIFKEEKERGNRIWQAFSERLWPAVIADKHFLSQAHPSVIIASIVAWYEECRKHLVIQFINLSQWSADVLCKNTLIGKDERLVHLFNSKRMLIEICEIDSDFREVNDDIVFLPEFWQPYRNLVLLSYTEKYIGHEKNKKKKITQ